MGGDVVLADICASVNVISNSLYYLDTTKTEGSTPFWCYLTIVLCKLIIYIVNMSRRQHIKPQNNQLHKKTLLIDLANNS